MSVTRVDSTNGFVVLEDEGDPYWFLNTLTITKIGSHHTQGDFSLVDHRMPAGFSPPPHIHHGTDEAFYVLDGQLDGFCGDREWRATEGSVVFLPRDVPHGYHVSDDAPARILIVTVRDRFDGFVGAVSEPARQLSLPEPVPPDGPLVADVAATFNIEILPPPA